VPGHIFVSQSSGLEKKRLQGVNELMVKMEIITNRMVHHMAKAFLYLQVFLTAIRAKLKFDIEPAIQAVMFFPVILFHF